MKRHIKAIAAAAAIIAPVAITATPASAQADPMILEVALTGAGWYQWMSGDVVVYEDELPAEWSVTAITDSDVESMTWTVTGDVNRQQKENQIPYYLNGDQAGDWNPVDLGPGSYEISATAYSEDGQVGVASTPYTFNLTIEDGSRPHYDYVVNSIRDAHDDNPGDGVCAATIDGLPHCTLRAAIEENNANPVGTIGVKEVEETVTSYQLTLGELPITRGVGIAGIDGVPTIDAQNLSRVMSISADEEVVWLNRLRLTSGSPEEGNTGGLVEVQKGLVWVLNSELTGGDARLWGGAIGVQPPEGYDGRVVLQVDYSTVHRNNAFSGGAISVSGENVTLGVNSSYITNNTAASGGGLATDEAQLNVINSVVAHNESQFGGSGIQAWQSDATISWTTIADNSSTRSDQDAAGLSTDSPQRMDISQTVITDNTAAGEPSDCKAARGTSFDFGPGNYLSMIADCRFQTSVLSASVYFEGPERAYFSQSSPAADGRVEYYVNMDGPIRFIGDDDLPNCPAGVDVARNDRRHEGCPAGAFAIIPPGLDITETDEPNGFESQDDQAAIEAPELDTSILETGNLELPVGIGSASPIDVPQLTVPGNPISIG